MGIEVEIKLNKFKPRPYQLPVMDAIINKGFRRVVAILPRRAGKDMVAWNLCIRECLTKVCVIYYIFPTYAQAKKVIWDSITNTGERILDYIPDEVVESKNSQEMKVRFKNGSLLQLVGSDNYDGLVGTNPQGVVFSEYALQDPRAYQFIRPILTANDGWALFISTPRGKNHLYELYQIALNSPDWFCYKLSVEDTGHISLHDIEKEKAEGLMSDDLIQQEYYCFPPDQLVLTYDRVKPISEIKKDELIISHSGRARKVLSTMARDYDGDLIEVRSFGSADVIKCTPNHPIKTYDPVGQTYAWKNADQLTLDDRLVFPKFHLGEFPVISYEMCMLLAWYISDGSSFKNGLQFTVNKKKSDRIIELLTKLAIEFTAHGRDSVINIVVNSVQLTDFFRAHCGVKCHDKRIPFTLISSYEEDFFHELMKGDGCLSDHNGHLRYSFTTTSKHLAYQVQLLSHSVNKGYAAGITKRKGVPTTFPHGKTYDTQDSYSVQIHFLGLRQRDSWLMRAKNCIAAKIISIDKVHYKGNVHNFSVQYDESYIVAGRAVHNCSFEMGVEGAYYTKYLDRMRLRGQIGEVPWEPGFKVHTVWDLGVRDSTTIAFFQVIGQTVKIIDCYENNKVGLEHYAKILSQKPYSYGKHIGPHDIKVRELGTGMTRLEKARQLGISFTVAPDVSIEDGIESVRSSLSKVWIDAKNCANLIKSLESYRQEWDHKRQVYKGYPLHDWASHWADTMRYLAISLPKTRDGLTPEELDKRYKEAMLGPQGHLPSVFRDERY